MFIFKYVLSLLCTMHLGLFLVALTALLAGPTILQVRAQPPQKRRTNNICSEDRDCPDNAVCRQQAYCVCRQDYIYVAITDTVKECLKVGKHGDPCVHDVQCQIFLGTEAHCSDGNCTCKPEMTFVEERCYKRALIGEQCSSHNNCYLPEAANDPDRQAFCLRGHCQCLSHYSPRSNGTRCVRDAKLGQPCEDDDQCSTEGLECRETCLCKPNFAAYEYLEICVPSVEALGDQCEYDAQCEHLSGVAGMYGIAVCSDGRCECAIHAHSVGTPGRCWFKRLPGHPCQHDEECVAEDDKPSSCIQGRCACKDCKPESSDGIHAMVSSPLAAILLTAAILA